MSTVTTKPKTVKAKDQASFPVQLIALANLQPSKTNPRKRFADASLRELANSIKRVGVLQAIVVRPLRTKVKLTKDVTVTEVTGRYEIVAGERRWRAAKLAGLTEIPATVRDLNDMEALEVQRIENLQRQDLDPVEEARGYKEMITEHNYTVEGLAAALAKSKAYVYGVLKLADLPPKAEEALVDGVISKSVAQLIGRVPNPKLREEATKEILGGRFRGQPMSYRQAEQFVQRKYMIELKQAPFSLQREDLVPKAGSCEACPKRAGNNPDLFPGTRADVCTDPTCYATKVKAHQEELLRHAQETGKKVLSNADAKKLFKEYQPTRLDYQAPYLDLADQCDQDRKYRSYKQLLGAALAEETVIAVDRKGQIHQLVPKDKGLKVLREKHKIGRGLQRSDGGAAWSRQQAKQLEEHRLNSEVSRRLMANVAESAELQMQSVTGWDEKRRDLFRAIVAGLLDEVWHDHKKKLLARREIKPKREVTNGRHADMDQLLRELVETLDPAGCVGLLAEIHAIRLANHYAQPKDKRFWKLFGIDKDKVKKEVQQKLAARKAKKKSKVRAGNK